MICCHWRRIVTYVVYVLLNVWNKIFAAKNIWPNSTITNINYMQCMRSLMGRFCLSVYLSVCLSVCMSVCLSVCLLCVSLLQLLGLFVLYIKPWNFTQRKDFHLSNTTYTIFYIFLSYVISWLLTLVPTIIKPLASPNLFYLPSCSYFATFSLWYLRHWNATVIIQNRISMMM